MDIIQRYTASYNSAKMEMNRKRLKLIEMIIKNNASSGSPSGDDGTGKGNFICIVHPSYKEFWFMNVLSAEVVTDGYDYTPSGTAALPEQYNGYDVNVTGGCLYVKTRVPTTLQGIMKGQKPSSTNPNAYIDLTKGDIEVVAMKRMTINNLLTNGTTGTIDNYFIDDISAHASLLPPLSAGSYDFTTNAGRSRVISMIWQSLIKNTMPVTVQYEF